MKCFFEFEVIIPDVVFDHVADNSIFDLLSSFNVKFECKGSSDSFTEYLVTASSYELARAVRDLFFKISRVVFLSVCSFPDKQRVKKWIYGVIREVESDEID